MLTVHCAWQVLWYVETACHTFLSKHAVSHCMQGSFYSIDKLRVILPASGVTHCVLTVSSIWSSTDAASAVGCTHSTAVYHG